MSLGSLVWHHYVRHQPLTVIPAKANADIALGHVKSQMLSSPGRIQIYHYKRKTKNLLSLYIYTAVLLLLPPKKFAIRPKFGLSSDAQLRLVDWLVCYCKAVIQLARCLMKCRVGGMGEAEGALGFEMEVKLTFRSESKVWDHQIWVVLDYQNKSNIWV